MKRYIQYLIFLILFISGVYFLKWLGRSPDPYINKIEDGYKGVITDKYFLKTTHLVIKKSDGQILDLSSLSPQLTDLSKVGDSIIKTQDSNCCKLIDNTTMTLQYLYVPKKILNDKRWGENASHLDLSCEGVGDKVRNEKQGL